MTGCSSPVKKAEETPYFSVAIDNQRVYRSEDAHDVLEIQELAEKFIKACYGFDYNSPDSLALLQVQ